MRSFAARAPPLTRQNSSRNSPPAIRICDRSDAELIVATIFEQITAALARGERVELRGFGAFTVKQRNALHRAQSCSTGVTVQVDDKTVPYFKAGLEMLRRAQWRWGEAPHLTAPRIKPRIILRYFSGRPSLPGLPSPHRREPRQQTGLLFRLGDARVTPPWRERDRRGWTDEATSRAVVPRRHGNRSPAFGNSLTPLRSAQLSNDAPSDDETTTPIVTSTAVGKPSRGTLILFSFQTGIWEHPASNRTPHPMQPAVQNTFKVSAVIAKNAKNGLADTVACSPAWQQVVGYVEQLELLYPALSLQTRSVWKAGQRRV